MYHMRWALSQGRGRAQHRQQRQRHHHHHYHHHHQEHNPRVSRSMSSSGFHGHGLNLGASQAPALPFSYLIGGSNNANLENYGFLIADPVAQTFSLRWFQDSELNQVYDYRLSLATTNTWILSAKGGDIGVLTSCANNTCPAKKNGFYQLVIGSTTIVLASGLEPPTGLHSFGTIYAEPTNGIIVGQNLPASIVFAQTQLTLDYLVGPKVALDILNDESPHSLEAATGKKKIRIQESTCTRSSILQLHTSVLSPARSYCMFSTRPTSNYCF